MRTISNGAAVLAWTEYGAGRPVLLVMGHRFSSAAWGWALDGLSSQARLVLFDNRGTGASNSPAGPYTMQDLAEDAFAVMDAAGLKSAAVYGVSMGGMIAQEMALLKPCRVDSLILGCTAARYPGSRPPHPASYLQYWLPKGLVLRLGRDLLYGPRATSDRVAADLELLGRDHSEPRGLIGQAKAITNFNALDRLCEIRQPTLILHGSHDKVFPVALARELAAGIKNSRLVLLDGAGHNYVADATDASNRAVVDFLSSIGPTSGGDMSLHR